MIRPRIPVDGDGIARHYDELDPFYRELWGEHLHHGLFGEGGPTEPQAAAARLLSLVAERAGIGRGTRVCDVGCGYGATARVLAGDYGAAVVGLTLSRAQLDHAATRVAHLPEVELRLQNWLENDLPDGSFDVVVAIESLSHMTDMALFFREAARVLRPGGRIVVCAWMSGKDPSAWERRTLLEPICTEGRLAGLASRDEILGLLAEAGLQLLSDEDLSRRVAPTWTVSARRVVGGLIRRSDYRRFLFSSGVADRVFALTVLRIRLAYALGAMRYGVFTGLRDGGSPSIPLPPR